MDKSLINQLHKDFEGASKTKDGLTYWLARDLQVLLGYTQWRRFEEVIEKAKISCEKAGQRRADHFADVGKMIELAKGAQRDVKDIMLTRYACYLIAQNGDPRKESTTFAQSYFAIQARKQELVEERMQLTERIQARAKLTVEEKQFSEVLYQRGVGEKGFGVIRSRGYEALFGGYNTKQIKKKFAVKEGRALADFLPSITLNAKALAASITKNNVEKSNLRGTGGIGDEHVKNNHDIRDLLAKSNIRPEELPPEEDIKRLERRVNSQDEEQLESDKVLDAVEELGW